MHAFSSYHGNRPTNTQTNPQTGPITILFKPRELAQNEDSGMPRVKRDLGSSFGWMTFFTLSMTLIGVRRSE